MLTQDRRFTLHDGRPAVIRSPEMDDAQALLDLRTKASVETPFTGRSPDDLRTTTAEDMARTIRNMNMDPRAYMLVCEVDGAIAAYAKEWFLTRQYESHRGAIALAVLMDYWRQGIGTHLVRTMQEIAAMTDGIEQLELTTASENYRAQQLYHDTGFRTVAVMPQALRMLNGYKMDRYFMTYDVTKRK